MGIYGCHVTGNLWDAGSEKPMMPGACCGGCHTPVEQTGTYREEQLKSKGDIRERAGGGGETLNGMAKQQAENRRKDSL